ncbi:MAG: DUF4255 domain-containing protein [Nostoc sp. ChiQUE02]|uniref:DUF4255 domain-containing protein n=1 Tax=Nostoc sp. ChiQUE02 TaxID=3075377 RepID=UPI002AD2B5F8|nr:DUF4255 domain-containing protein [Nostoc sp. ChiQUE02]MDZ8234853.1 DUF4255 domain-containing protein [Nostoc sp. ChiQUE02]
MSNYLALATVTATIKRILETAIDIDLPGAKVTTLRPGAGGSDIPELRVNIYLYQAIPSPAWRNSDLRARRPKGELIKQAQAGLDLYYLMTFYGNEAQLEPQRLMGSAVRTLVDYPILTSEMIRSTLDNPGYSFLAGSTLDQQVERVTIVPSNMNTDEFAKVWSSFFQPPYALSFAFQGSAVLIDGNKPSGRALPVRGIATYSTPNQPKIEPVINEAGANQPIVATSRLIVRGNLMAGNRPTVKLGDAQLTQLLFGEREIILNLANLPLEQKSLLRAGIQSLQVLYPTAKVTVTSSEPEHLVGSNLVPLILCPSVVCVNKSEVKQNLDELYGADVEVEVDLTVGVGQRVSLFLNERSSSNPAAYIFAAKERLSDGNLVSFRVSDVKPGEYLLRVQIDGGESPLLVDTDADSDFFGQYVSPTVAIG